jgi:hypothetical protein
MDRGLIVKAGDTEAEEFAEEKFKERAEFLWKRLMLLKWGNRNEW